MSPDEDYDSAKAQAIAEAYEAEAEATEYRGPGVTPGMAHEHVLH